jgi:hypothetical protein
MDGLYQGSFDFLTQLADGLGIFEKDGAKLVGNFKAGKLETGIKHLENNVRI